jgi:hypothetical protein
MCRVSVTCCCSRRGGDGGLVLVAAGALVFLAAPVLVAALQAAVDLLTAVVIGIVVAAGVVVVGWVIKGVAEKVIEERSLRRHNERMAQIHPHLQAELQRVHRPAVWGPPTSPRVVEPPRRAAIAASGPVQIYPTPRTELRAAIAPRHRGSGDE